MPKPFLLQSQKIAVCLAMVMTLGACDTVFDVHPYDVRVKGETDVNAKNIQLIEQAVKTYDTIRFAVISSCFWVSYRNTTPTEPSSH